MRLQHPTRPVRLARHIAATLLALGLAAIAVPTLAQESREAELAAAQADKAADLHPFVPSVTERRIERVIRLTVPRPGWYPFIGSVFPGGSVAVGPGYRRTLRGTAAFDAHLARSVKSYTAADALVSAPTRGRMRLALRANWTDAPRVAFFGVGPASRDEDRTSFLYRASAIDGAVQVDVTHLLEVGGSFGYLDVHSGLGSNRSATSPVFTALAVPGDGASPAFARTHLFVQADSRPSPAYATSGGLYRVDWSHYAARADAPYSFDRIDAEVVQLIPLLRENWVIALRAAQSVTPTRGGNLVPYFLMPDLGGSSDLRGYPSWRFRDRDRTLVSAEYRWTANRFMDMALFTDAGAVTPRLRIRRSELRASYGIGGRFHTPSATVLRVDLARTTEGMGLIIAFGPSF